MKLALLSAAATALALPALAQDTSYCREFTQTITIGGKTQKGYGTACLQPDGSWELQSNAVATPPADNRITSVAPADNITYVVEDDHVFITPPEPFVVGTVFIGGNHHHFGPGFSPSHRWGGAHGHGGYHH
ncbi:MAG: hypothetical protein GC129_06490 [Proteobacteria bacterium]|nr:hypothetical protein [Pseudomonadota bacterium]